MNILRIKSAPSLLCRVFSVLIFLGLLNTSCEKKKDDYSDNLPESVLLTHLPVDSTSVNWIGPHGFVDHGGGNAFFHNGIDINTDSLGEFYSCAYGFITDLDLNTGQGYPGTNYRINIKIATTMELDYHFEIGGSVAEQDRADNIFVEVGDTVQAGQLIGNLIVVSDAAHVHFGVYKNNQADSCPLNYFSTGAAQKFENLYDSGIEKRPNNRPDLCE